MSGDEIDTAYWTGYTTQPPHPAPCGCTTVIIVYGIYDTSRDPIEFLEAVNWCPRCESTWTGLEYRRYYGTADSDGRYGVG